MTWTELKATLKTLCRIYPEKLGQLTGYRTYNKSDVKGLSVAVFTTDTTGDKEWKYYYR